MAFFGDLFIDKVNAKTKKVKKNITIWYQAKRTQIVHIYEYQMICERVNIYSIDSSGTLFAMYESPYMLLVTTQTIWII